MSNLNLKSVHFELVNYSFENESFIVVHNSVKPSSQLW